MKKNSWLKRFFSGIFMGIGQAIPGISAEAMAIVFRVKKDITKAFKNIKSSFKDSFVTLLPIGLGLLIAFVGCLILFEWAFNHIMFIALCVFAGFLIGSLPKIISQIRGVPVNKENIFIAVGCGLFVIAIGVISIVLGNKGIYLEKYFTEIEGGLAKNWWMFFIIFVVAIVATLAVTVPGLSASLILLIFTLYKPILDGVTSWTLQVFHGVFDNTLSLGLLLITLIAGCVVGLVFLRKPLKNIISKHHTTSQYVVLGLTIGSVLVLFLNYQTWQYYGLWNGAMTSTVIEQNLEKGIEIASGIFVLLMCVFFSYMIVRMQRNLENNKK